MNETLIVDSLRLNTVIVGHDEAQQALRLALAAEPEIARGLIEHAMSCLSEAAGQLNWYRADAEKAAAAYSQEIFRKPLLPRPTDDDLLKLARSSARIRRALMAQREARSGAQREDAAPCSREPILVTREHVWAQTPDGKQTVPVHVKSEGYGCLDDASPLPDLEKLLPSERVGARVLYAADAIGGEFVGSITGGQLQEICYELDDARWYLYLLNQSGGDTWHQEWWVSHKRLDAHTAADAIEAARRFTRA